MQPQFLFHFTDKLVYLSLLIVGTFFIYQGDVIPRFWMKRTNFADHSEQITELPTIVTYPNPPDTALKFGKDFNISLKVYKWDKTFNLTEGRNIIHQESNFGIFFEKIYKENGFKLTPIGAPPDFTLTYALTYQFENTTYGKDALIDVGFSFTSENNSVAWAIVGENHFDGEGDSYTTGLGQMTILTMVQEKYTYLKELEDCREKPFNELLFNEIAGADFSNCSKPCRRNWLYGESLNKIIAHLPACENTEEEKCFEDVLQRVRKNIVDKPCTKLQYKGRHQTFNLEKNQFNTLVLAYRFANPPKMLVKEEYLIYDGISMISAIGGTLGLFIGFSFNSFLRFIIRALQSAELTNIQ